MDNLLFEIEIYLSAFMWIVASTMEKIPDSWWYLISLAIAAILFSSPWKRD